MCNGESAVFVLSFAEKDVVAKGDCLALEGKLCYTQV